MTAVTVCWILERSEGTGKVRYMYDTAGNLTKEQHSQTGTGGQTEQTEAIRYAYDTFGRTTEVCGTTFQQKNRYDAEGLRYELEENDKVSRFVYHQGMMLAELDERNQVTGSQYLGNGYIGGKLSRQAGENSRSNQTDEKASISKERELCYYIRDEQGSIRYVLDQSGNVVNEYQYSAFGETEWVKESYESRLRYNAQMHDGLTEQYYLRARYYQPKIGRFTQEDLLYEDGLNLYAYCKSNPVMYCDPRGLARKTSCDSKVQAEEDSGTRDIYRAVSPEEFEDIMDTKGFRGRPDGRSYEAKQFGNDFGETLDLANQSIMRDTAAIIKVTIPDDVYTKLNHMPLDVGILKSGAVTVEPDMLEIFNNSIIDIQHEY